MSKLIDRVERVLFGATTEERVGRVVEHVRQAHQRMEDRLADRIVAALESEDEDEDEDDESAEREASETAERSDGDGA